MNYLKKIIIFFLIGISVNCEEITRINNNERDDKNWLSMEIEKDEKIKGFSSHISNFYVEKYILDEIEN